MVFAAKFEVGQLGHTIITIYLDTLSFIRCSCIQRYDMSWQGHTMTVPLVVHVKESRVRITPVKSKLIFHRDLTITRGAKSPIEAWAAAFHAIFDKLHGQMVGRYSCLSRVSGRTLPHHLYQMMLM
jgi:ATP-dependent protease ClpP protease subunit